MEHTERNWSTAKNGKMTRLARNTKKIGFEINANKRNIENKLKKPQRQALKNCRQFTYVGSIICESGRTEVINNRTTEGNNRHKNSSVITKRCKNP